MAKITRFPGVLLAPEARLIWVWLFKPKKFDNGEKFVTDVIFNPAQMATPEFKAMQDAARTVAQEAFGTRLQGLIAAEKFTNPFWKNERKIDAETGKLPAGYEPGGCYITVKASLRPKVVVASANGGFAEIIDEAEVYGGMWGRVSLDCFAYEDKSNGVSFGLRTLLKTKDDEPLGSGGRPDPNKDFAGIAAPPAAQAGGAASAESLFT